jgi:hypothetical protein
MIGYFDLLSAAIAEGEVSEGRLVEIATEHSMEVTGPVPESYAWDSLADSD